MQPANISKPSTNQLVDAFGRHINYLRLSVTDRCNLRCFYCIRAPIKHPTSNEILSLEELELIARAFMKLGITKIRITGGEPLVRRGILQLIADLDSSPNLHELDLTTNGVLLSQYARQIRYAGIDRINISLDTLQPQRFNHRTGSDNLEKVFNGIEAARQSGFARVKINALITAGDNDDEVTQLIDFATERGLDITFIEEMPLGGGVSSNNNQTKHGFVSSHDIRSLLPNSYQLMPAQTSTGGPARYYRRANHSSDSLIGFISARSEHFCDTCNRIRLTATGQMVLCLGHPHAVDLRYIIRNYPGDEPALLDAIRSGVSCKPWGHNFDQTESVDTTPLRAMSTTGG